MGSGDFKTLSSIHRPSTRGLLQQKHIYTMRMDHLLAWGPCEDRKPTILRRYERESVALIVYKLRRREVSRAAILYSIDHDSSIADDRFSYYDSFNRCTSRCAPYLCSECQQLILVAEHRSAVNRSEACNSVACATDIVVPEVLLTHILQALPHQHPTRGETKHKRIQDRMHHRLGP